MLLTIILIALVVVFVVTTINYGIKYNAVKKRNYELETECRQYKTALQETQSRIVKVSDTKPKDNRPQSAAMKLQNEIKDFIYLDGDKICLEIYKGKNRQFLVNSPQKPQKKKSPKKVGGGVSENTPKPKTKDNPNKAGAR